MTEGWIVFQNESFGRPSTVTVDARRGQFPMMPHYPSLGIVTIFSGGTDDFDALAAQLRETAESAGHAVFVGQTSNDVRRDLFFYCKTAVPFQMAIDDAMDAHPDMNWEMGSRDDADWSVFSFFLFPPPDAVQRLRNGRVRHAMQEHADDGEEPRQITHWAYFALESQRDAFVLQLIGHGFENIEPTTGRCGVRFTRIDAPNEIDALTIDLDARAAAMGGEYDGWECAISNADRVTH